MGFIEGRKHTTFVAVASMTLLLASFIYCQEYNLLHYIGVADSRRPAVVVRVNNSFLVINNSKNELDRLQLCG